MQRRNEVASPRRIRPRVFCLPLHVPTAAGQFNRRSKQNSAKIGRFHGSIEELEEDIDRLLFKVMQLGGLPAIEESLRQTRRLLYGGFSGSRS